MRFGFIGAGHVARAIASKLLAQGHQVALSSRRGPPAIADDVACLGSGAEAVSVQDAAALDIVILAVPWSEAQGALSGLPPWDGRILVDTTNPFVAGAGGLAVADLGGRSSSTLLAVQDGGRRVLFVSGDDDTAKGELRGMLEAIGYAVIDLGGLDSGGRLQQGGGPLAGKDLLMLADWQLGG